MFFGGFSDFVTKMFVKADDYRRRMYMPLIKQSTLLRIIVFKVWVIQGLVSEDDTLPGSISLIGMQPRAVCLNISVIIIIKAIL